MVDCPGYGYAKVSNSEKDEWKLLMLTYLTKSPDLHRAVMLIDSEVGFQDSDKMLIEMLTSLNQIFMLVMTKADKVTSHEI